VTGQNQLSRYHSKFNKKIPDYIVSGISDSSLITASRSQALVLENRDTPNGRPYSSPQLNLNLKKQKNPPFGHRKQNTKKSKTVKTTERQFLPFVYTENRQQFSLFKQTPP
jgi:hypothetical protein